MRIRYRVDGVLHEISTAIPARLQIAIISRIKVLANLDIAEKRLPQDGRIADRKIAGKESTCASPRPCPRRAAGEEHRSIRILDPHERRVLRLREHRDAPRRLPGVSPA